MKRNVNDFFTLKNLFSLWMESYRDLQLTLAESAVALGGRRPLRPTAKDGTVAEVGSSADPSSRLQELDRETGPLRRLPSCSYKRTSAEPDFRQVGFAVDWCAFRLLNASQITVIKRTAPGPPPPFPTTPGSGFASREKIERRTASPRSLLWGLLVPLVLFAVLNGLIGCFLLSDAATASNEKQAAVSFVDVLYDVLAGCLGSGEPTSHLPVLSSTTNIIINNNNINSDINNEVNNASSSCHSSSPSVPDLQQVQGGGSAAVDTRGTRASSVQRQTDTLRSLARRRDVTPRLHQNWERSSVHSRSRTASPCPSALTDGTCAVVTKMVQVFGVLSLFREKKNQMQTQNVVQLFKFTSLTLKQAI
jgi:hypothetical protein